LLSLFHFDGEWVVVLVEESLCPFHLLIVVLLATLGAKFVISIYIRGEKKTKTPLFCVVGSLEVNSSSWRLRREKKENLSG